MEKQPLTVESSVRLISARGPLTPAELRSLSSKDRIDYFTWMDHALERLGEEEFLTRKDQYRRTVLAQIARGGMDEI